MRGSGPRFIAQSAVTLTVDDVGEPVLQRRCGARVDDATDLNDDFAEGATEYQ